MPFIDVAKAMANWTKCPYCQSEMIEGDSVTIDGSTAEQQCTCTECGKSWIDIYMAWDRKPV